MKSSELRYEYHAYPLEETEVLRISFLDSCTKDMAQKAIDLFIIRTEPGFMGLYPRLMMRFDYEHDCVDHPECAGVMWGADCPGLGSYQALDGNVDLVTQLNLLRYALCHRQSSR